MPFLLRAAVPLMAALVLALSLPGRAEIAKMPEREAAPVVRSVPLGVECWQQGQRIIAERGLKGPNLGAVLREQALLLTRRDGGGAEVVIVALGDTTCLLQPVE